jgi:hypothetical protein
VCGFRSLDVVSCPVLSTGRQDKAANASFDPHTVNGHKVYSLWTESGMGYRTVAGAAKGVAAPANIYICNASESQTAWSPRSERSFER